MNRVLIIEEQVKHYRVPFYEGLYAALRSDGIQLQVAYSEPRASERAKQDQSSLPEEYGIKIDGYWFLNRLLLQPLFRKAAHADLVIIDEGNRFLMKHVLLPFSAWKLKKLALWGLGENKEPDRLAVSEWYKMKALHWITWWFAYTPGTVEYLVRHGFPGDRITMVQNSVDTRKIREWIANFSEAEVSAARSAIAIPPSVPVGIYCGTLDKVKKIPFLVESAKIVRRRIEDFHLIVVGRGSDLPYLEEQVALNRKWLHWLGPSFTPEKDKALLFKMADICLMPGRVGLGILDSFAAGLPLLTTKIPIHSPEVEYLEDGCNGLVTEPSPQAYADAVIRLLSTQDELRTLKAGAQASCQRYSIETMVNNFHRGIRDCLSWS
jgi:L-malate glycosyltransferase